MHDDTAGGFERTIPYWRHGVTRRPRPPLDTDTRAAVGVIGAGIAGLSTAYALAREGVEVVVLDAGQIASGMTERTSAHLSNAVDDRFVAIERRHGADGARICAESHTAAIEFIAAAVEREGIDCGFERVDGFLFAGAGRSTRRLEDELDAARRAGLRDTELVARAPIEGFDTGRCLRFPRQAQFHPLRYVAGIADAVERHGGRIFCGTKVTDVVEGRSISMATARGVTVTADNVVVATNSPVNDRFAIHTKQSAYRTYVIAGLVPTAAVTKALFWDDEDPYHYVRTSAHDDAHALLIVGGEDHKTGQEDDGAARFAALERWARERFMQLGPVAHRWSGQVLEPFDGVAFIGRNPGSRENVYIATGDSGMGLTHGSIAAILLADLIAGRGSPWKELYDPSRKMLSAPLEYAKENLNVAKQYLEGYPGRGDVDSVDAIAPGSGATIRDGTAKVAVYRDDDGSLHECSAVCTHLGCIVRWNSVERTWDCPCHGSRFDRFGKVITGPANRDLAPRA